MWPVSTDRLRCPDHLRNNVHHDQPVRRKSPDSAEPANAILSAGAVPPERRAARAVPPERRAARAVPPKWRAAWLVCPKQWAARTIRPAVTHALWPAAVHYADHAGASAGHHDLDLRDPRHFHHHLRAHRLVPGKQGQE